MADGQSPFDALVREAFEEAGLLPAQAMQARAAPSIDDFPDNAIVVAEEMSATTLMDLPREKIRAIATVGGSSTSHMAIVARTMGPAALLDYDRAKLRGLVLEDGGPSSHVAIIARALGKRPEDRYQRAAEFANDLRAFLKKAGQCARLAKKA